MASDAAPAQTPASKEEDVPSQPEAVKNEDGARQKGLSSPESESKDAHVASTSTENTNDAVPNETISHKSWQFWSVFLSMCLISFICSIDTTVVVTALPTITRQLGGDSKYVWIANAFTFASTAPQPLFAQVSNIVGRRYPIFVAVSLFALGSGICGGASSVGMLIAGRTVQGLGAGGTFVLLDIIICDLVPLRERGQYLGIVLSTAAIGVTVGPLIGGGLAESNWRWIFYLNLPFSGIALVLIFFFFNLKFTRPGGLSYALHRIDLVGSALFIPSVIAVLFGLTFGGVMYPWGSYHIIMPLVLGFVGWAIFHVHQATPRLCPEPSIPPHLFTNRTSAVGFLLTLVSAMIIQALGFFMPVYFQAVLGTTALRAGVYLLPTTVAVVPFGIIAGVLLAKTGAYRPLHAGGMAMAAVGAGLLTLLSVDNNPPRWVIPQIILAGGGGIVATVALPAILAALPESDVAAANGAFSFIRSFGYVWGVTLPSIIFNGRFNALSSERLDDEAVRSRLANGGAYGYASGEYVASLEESTKEIVKGIYVDSLRTIWWAMLAFALFGFFAVGIERHVELRKELDTEFGLEDKSKTETVEAGEKKTNV